MPDQKAILKEEREALPFNLNQSATFQMLARSIDPDELAAMDAEVTETVRAVQDLGKKGNLVFAIELVPKGNSKLKTTFTFKPIIPREKMTGILYTDDHGNSYGHEPGQQMLFDRVVDIQPDAPVEVSAPTETPAQEVS